MSFQCTPSASGGTATLIVTNVIHDADGVWSYEASPSFVQAIPLPTGTNLQRVAFPSGYLAGNYFTLALVNTNGVALTNLTVEVLFKMTKRGTVDAAR